MDLKYGPCFFTIKKLFENVKSTENDEIVIGGYKPVLSYNEILYWLDGAKIETSIPDDYEIVGKAECIINDPFVLPNKQLESNLIWGTEVFANKKKEFLFCRYPNGAIEKFVREDLIEE